MMTVVLVLPASTVSARTPVRPPGPVTTLRSVGSRTAHPSELFSAPVLRTLSSGLTENVNLKVDYD